MELVRIFTQSLDRHKDRLCIDCNHLGQRSYGDLLDEAARCGGRLPESKQLVFVEAHASIPSIVAYVGALAAGHCVHLLDPDKEDENDALIETYMPNYLIRCDHHDYEIETRHERDWDIHPELAILLSTSGSTGSRKLVKLSYGNIQSNTESIVEYLNMRETDRTVTSLKLHYSYGLSVVNTHLAVGGAIILSDASVQDQNYWNMFGEHRATNFSGVPYTYEIIDKLGVDFSAFSDLRFMTQAGGKLAPHLVRHFATLGEKQGWLFYVMYGQTEASPRMSYLPPELATKHPECIGIAIPGGRLSLADDDGDQIEAAEQQGELVYEGPNVMVGYALSARDLATKDPVDRLFTGDLAIRNADGLFRITGRKGRFVKPFGLRLSLDDIESYLGQLNEPGFVVGQDRQIVVLAESRKLPEDLVYQLADKYQLPASLFVTRTVASVPLLSNGKVDYRSLEAAHLTETAGPSSVFAIVREFAGRFWIEFRALLVGGSKNWSSIQEIFEVYFRGRTVEPDSSFITLGGDSLLYVEMSICLQEYLDYLPNQWQSLTISQLQAASGNLRA